MDWISFRGPNNEIDIGNFAQRIGNAAVCRDFQIERFRTDDVDPIQMRIERPVKQHISGASFDAPPAPALLQSTTHDQRRISFRMTVTRNARTRLPLLRPIFDVGKVAHRDTAASDVNDVQMLTHDRFLNDTTTLTG